MRRALLAAALLGTSAAPVLAQARSPHTGLQGTACTACHFTDSWRGVSFDHRHVGFELRGRHLAVPCSGCHDVKDFRGAVTQCAACHQDPHRGDAGGRCEQCHSESGWRFVNPQDAHARSRLPDLGVHASLRCEDCHRQTGVQPFHGPVAPCATCHQATFVATTNPSHVTLAFPRSCETCHQMATWRFALFAQHDAIFAIYSGAHAGNWSSCASCHTVSADYKQFTCVTCHTDARTSPRHAGIPGYQWTSAACLLCHPAGRTGDLSFHDAIFPIFTAPHGGAWSACSDCHTDPNNRQTISCLGGACHAQAATDPPHNLIPGYGYTTAQCRSCHPDGRAGTFAQHDAVFPINSGTHAGRWTSCAQCHTTPGNRAIFTCVGSGCHIQSEMDNHHAQIAGYGPDPASCYRCHPTGRKP